MKNPAENILLLAGRALLTCQIVEYYLTTMCRMLSDNQKLDPKQDSSLFGNTKERTASLGTVRKALKAYGIDGRHYLNDEIIDFISRRDWLAHRMFIDLKGTKEQTMKFQKESLEELIERASRLLSVCTAVTRQITKDVSDISLLPTNDTISQLCYGYEDEANGILTAMMNKTLPPKPKQ
jgi:hypothetical protein